MKKILLATIVPFWNRETGAQQRIFSLVKVLQRHGHQVRTFFPGHAEQSDRDLAQQIDLDIAFHSSDHPQSANRSLGKKLRWQFDAVMNVFKSKGTEDCRDAPLTLSDFRWPWAEADFQTVLQDFSPDAIICEYLTMAYLVSSMPRDMRAKIHCLVDTHDLLSQRQQQFAQNNRSHWINVSPEEEAAALNVFDTVIAIQPREAELIESMTADNNVIVVGHSPHVTSAKNCSFPSQQSVKLTLGYIASDNDSNTDAINQFLELVWKRFKDEKNLSLTIAGNVIQRVAENLRFSNVKLLGRVSKLEQFYDSVDAVINPVGYGTGLKIKSVEATAYHKPLLCTAGGWVGKPVGGVTVVESIEDMKSVIERWLENPTAFQEARSAAALSAETHSDLTYTPLLNLLTQL